MYWERSSSLNPYKGQIVGENGTIRDITVRLHYVAARSLTIRVATGMMLKYLVYLICKYLNK
jgi:hypothetical protein